MPPGITGCDLLLIAGSHCDRANEVWEVKFWPIWHLYGSYGLSMKTVRGLRFRFKLLFISKLSLVGGTELEELGVLEPGEKQEAKSN